MSFGEVDRIAKLVPTELKITLDKAIERVPELQQVAQASGNEGKLVEYARKLEGMARHASVHACAVINRSRRTDRLRAALSRPQRRDDNHPVRRRDLHGHRLVEDGHLGLDDAFAGR